MVAGARLVLACAVVAFTVAVAVSSSAQPVRDRVFSRVEISERDGCSIVRVVMNFPIRYVSHFPLGSGDELRIMLRPIVAPVEDLNALIRRETASIRSGDRGAIEQIVYEGDVVGTPTVTVIFRQTVAFQVGQGADYRSLVIAVSGPAPSDSCRPGSAD